MLNQLSIKNVACVVFSASIFVACISASAQDSSPQQTFDKLGNPITIVTAVKDDSDSIHDNNRISSLEDEFFCKGQKLKIIISERYENRDRISVDLDIFFNGIKLSSKDTQKVARKLPNYEFYNTNFACFDQTIRVEIEAVSLPSDDNTERSVEFISEILFGIGSGNLLLVED